MMFAKLDVAYTQVDDELALALALEAAMATLIAFRRLAQPACSSTNFHDFPPQSPGSFFLVCLRGVATQQRSHHVIDTSTGLNSHDL